MSHFIPGVDKSQLRSLLWDTLPLKEASSGHEARYKYNLYTTERPLYSSEQYIKLTVPKFIIINKRKDPLQAHEYMNLLAPKPFYLLA